MSVPDWRTFKSGARARVALWLHSEVGVGGVFTKANLRDAFPGVEQIDRRMRDLRPEGWIISSYQEDRSLAVAELRLVEEGGAVWERGYESRKPRAVTAKERQAAMRADDFACVLCGIGGGETFPDDPLRPAKLSVVQSDSSDGQERRLSTMCNRCLAGGTDQDVVGLLAEINALPPEQRDELSGWIQRGSRPRRKEEVLWGRYKRLTEADRDSVARHLRK